MASRVNTALSCFLEQRRLAVPFDVVEAPSWMGEAFLIAVFGSLPLVVYLVTSPGIEHATAQKRPPWDLRLADRFERFVIDRAHVVTTPSRLALQTLGSEHPQEHGRIRLVRYTVDLECWASPATTNITKPLVLFVGRLEARKAPETLVEAIALLAAEVDGLEAVFIGRSNGRRNGIDYRIWLAEYAQQLHAPCRFLGQVSSGELLQWYRSARVVAVPSRFESFSLVAAEAMAASRPVVLTTTTGIAELVARSDAGKTVPPDDPAALAQALRFYLTDATRAGKAGMAGRHLVEEYCTPETIAKEREGCYQEAILKWKLEHRRHKNSTGLLITK